VNRRLCCTLPICSTSTLIHHINALHSSQLAPQSSRPRRSSSLPLLSLFSCLQVTGATFDKEAGLWTVTSASGATVRGRVLVCADGATSQLATKLGYCTGAC
jgi:hypothetical protein